MPLRHNTPTFARHHSFCIPKLAVGQVKVIVDLCPFSHPIMGRLSCCCSAQRRRDARTLRSASSAGAFGPAAEERNKDGRRALEAQAWQLQFGSGCLRRWSLCLSLRRDLMNLNTVTQNTQAVPMTACLLLRLFSDLDARFRISYQCFCISPKFSCQSANPW